MEKIDYFASSLIKRIHGGRTACPNCGSSRHEIVDRKYVVTDLRRCGDCKLQFRAPTRSAEDESKFYQRAYRQGTTTDMPDDTALQRMKDSGFTGAIQLNEPNINYDAYIGALRALGLAPGARIFDFGCSWGYGSWQLAKAGYDVTAYEISAPRAAFARDKLGVTVLAELPRADVPGEFAASFDCFFSSHVIEHVPKPADAVALAAALLKPGGLFVAYTPNGTAEYRAHDPESWHRLWGKVHPNMIDDEFWRAALGGRPCLFGATPVAPCRLEGFAKGRIPEASLGMQGYELFCVARF